MSKNNSNLSTSNESSEVAFLREQMALMSRQMEALQQQIKSKDEMESTIIPSSRERRSTKRPLTFSEELAQTGRNKKESNIPKNGVSNEDENENIDGNHFAEASTSRKSSVRKRQLRSTTSFFKDKENAGESSSFQAHSSAMLLGKMVKLCRKCHSEIQFDKLCHLDLTVCRLCYVKRKREFSRIICLACKELKTHYREGKCFECFDTDMFCEQVFGQKMASNL